MNHLLRVILVAGVVVHSLPAGAEETPAPGRTGTEASPAPSGPPTDEAAPRELRGWFLELPFQRILDLQVGLAGWPGLWGLGLEANPLWFLTLEVCWNSNYNILSNYNDVSIGAKSRLLEWVGLTLEGSEVYGNQVGLGPAIAYRFAREVTYEHWGSGTETDDFSSVDVGLALEWVYWASRYFGFSMQWEVGPEFMFRDDEMLPTFYIRYSIGASF